MEKTLGYGAGETAELLEVDRLPDWVPEAALLYLLHTEAGVPLRVIARETGRHPSTVMRQVRRFENRRDDPLVDEALFRLGRLGVSGGAGGVNATDHLAKDPSAMSYPATPRAAAMAATPSVPGGHGLSDDATLEREARRILRRLTEVGAVLAIAPDMEKAVVLKEASDGSATRIAVLARAVAQAFALKDWIACRKTGRVSTYAITTAGRAALRRLLAADPTAPGMAEAQTPFSAQHGDWETRDLETADGPARLRFNTAESPVAMLARRRDRDGKPFLSPELVAAAERLREDFEVAQMGPRVAQNWERFLTGGARGGYGGGSGPAEGPRGARERVAVALHDLGPGLADVALRCCCFLEGLEAAEQRMGWSARSGKVVLRIALTRLKRHYDSLGARARMIG